MAEARDYRDWKGWGAERFGVISPEDGVYFRAELARAGVSGDALDVLEIGFGNGSFMAHCRDAGWRVGGTEVDDELVARARDAGFEAHDAETPLAEVMPGRSLDLVVAFDVFEHIEIEALIDLLRALKARLKHGGRILARFPSGDSPFSGAMFHGDMTHRTYLGSGKVQQIALAAGLELAFIAGQCLPIRGLGARRAARRLAVRTAQWAITAFLDVVFYNNAGRVLAPNMVAVLRAPARGAAG